MGRAEGQRPLGRPGHRLKNNIWIGLMWLRRGTDGGCCDCSNELWVSCLKNCTCDMAHPLHSPCPVLITLIT